MLDHRIFGRQISILADGAKLRFLEVTTLKLMYKSCV